MGKLKQLIKNGVRVNNIAWKEKKWWMISTVFISLLFAVQPYASSGVSALLINNLTANFGNNILTNELLWLALASALLLFIPDILASIQAFVDKRLWIDLHQKIQLLFFKKKGEIDIQTYEDPAFQDILNKAEDNGSHTFPNFLENQLMSVRGIIGVVLGLAILLAYNWVICLIVIIAIIPQFISEIKYNDDTWGIWDSDTATRRRHNNLRSHFEEKNWLIELKLFQNVKLFYEKIKNILGDFNKKQIVVEKKKLLFEIGAAVISGGIISAVTFWIILQVIQGRTEIGTMLFIISSIERLQGSLLGFLKQVARLHEQSLYITDIFKVFETKPALYRAEHPITLDGGTPEIVFENVSFSYPHKEALTLKDISLTIKPGEKFALVGENGAGKTTFVKLLCRIYDPTEGRILVNGHDLKDIDLESWYKTLGILFQEYAPYKFPVEEAISFGRSSDPYDFERIQKAAAASESESFIVKWPDQYQQMLGTEFEKGIDPSKGQQQRLSIARLLHRKAGLLILDEPTASIDAEAEKKIFEQIEKEAKDQTVILISHKYSTVRSADRICVFKDQSVHELGSHEELIKNKGTYAKLFNEQAKAYK